MTIPKVIFFDAGGTLFEVRGSVGEIYQRYAARHGLQSEAHELQRRFRLAFQAQPPLAFPVGLEPAELDRRERAWWRKLVAAVFGDDSAQPAFEDFFGEIYQAFTHAAAWDVFADVVPTLAILKARGIRLAIVSNFDSRLDQILAATDLAGSFDAVYVSTRCGAAKPDARFFAHALRAQGVAAHEAWHIGDAWREDVEGAAQAGLRAFWLHREVIALSPEQQRVHLASLRALPL